jgi:hypothetical protein
MTINFRGHLANISNNLLITAINSENEEMNKVSMGSSSPRGLGFGGGLVLRIRIYFLRIRI